MGVPSFRGIHNQRKAQVLFILQRYTAISPGGHGLILNELVDLLKLRMDGVGRVCLRLNRWKYTSVALTPQGRRQCIYKISAKGSKWLSNWSPIIPWERYGWTADTIAEIDRKIKEIVEFRGYK